MRIFGKEVTYGKTKTKNIESCYQINKLDGEECLKCKYKEACLRVAKRYDDKKI